MRTRQTQQEPLTFEKVWQMFQKTDKKFQETREQMKETDKLIRKISGDYNNKWGKLIEALVEPSALDIFKKRGIAVTSSSRRYIIEKNGRKIAEYDVFLKNKTEIVLIEVKTTCLPDDVDKFIEAIPHFKKEFSQYTIYGAVASIIYDARSDMYAINKGLFVLKAGSKGLVRMLNDKKFKPKTF